jgi:hypothetical protein
MFAEAQVTNLLADLSRKIELPSPCPSGKMLESNGANSPPQVNCVDPAGGGSGSQHQVNGANLASNNPINFQDSVSVSLANPSAGIVQASVKDGAITAAKLSVSSPSSAQLSGVSDNNIAAGALAPDRVAGTAVVQSRTIAAASPLSGGGDLSADRTINCPTCEVNTNKGAANGYASLNASSKVVQDPAGAQTTPGASKIPLADGAGKLADGWLSSNVSLLGNAVDLASEVSGLLPTANGGTGANNTATSGRYLKGNGTNFVTSSGAAAGAGSCTNQVVTATNSDAAPTCASVSGSLFTNQNANLIFAGPSSGGAAAPSFRAMVKADTPGTTVHTDQGNTWSSGTQNFGSAGSLIIPKAPGAAPTADGDVAYDTTQASLKNGRGDIALTGFIPRVLHASHQAQQITNSVATEQDFTSQFTIPASFFLDKKSIRVCAGFHVNSSASSVPTHIYKLKLGTTVVWSMAAVSPGASQNFGMEACWTVMSTGAPGASVNIYTESLPTGIYGAVWKNNTTQPVGVATNASKAVTISITFSNTTAGNDVTLEYLLIREDY